MNGYLFAFVSSVWTAVALILWDRVLTVRDKWPLLAFKAGAVGWGFVGLTLLFRQII